MNETAINWDSIPDIITKDQLYRICHISKSTALYLLRSGKIPCEYNGKKTRCYKIKKKMLSNILKIERYFQNHIPHRQVGTRETIPSK